VGGWPILGAKKTRTTCRLYCSTGEECKKAEKSLGDAGIPYIRFESDSVVPLLIALQQTCRGLDEILQFVSISETMKKEYSVDWY